MSLATAQQMVAAEILKLRHNRGTAAWALVLAVAVPGVYLTYQGLSGNNGPWLPGLPLPTPCSLTSSPGPHGITCRGRLSPDCFHRARTLGARIHHPRRVADQPS